MSYAAVVAANADDNQPLPDKGLLNTAEPSYDAVADDGSKVNVVAPDFKQHPETVTSQAREAIDEQVEINEKAAVAKDAAHEARVRKAPVHDETPESDDYYSIIKKYVARPGVAGGLLGIVNIGLIAVAGRAFYSQRVPANARTIGASIAAGLAIFGAEGYAAEQYAQTERGKEEAAYAKKEGTLLYRHAREIVLRPGVLGGLLGVANAAVLSAVGYYSYLNWDKPKWDRRVVSAVSVGLLTLFGGEGAVAERYRESRH